MDINSIKDWAKPIQTAAHTSAASASKVGTASAPNSLAGSDQEQQAGTAASASRQDIETAVGNIQEFVQSVKRNLSFSLDESTERVVVKVTDAVSGEVIRQIPSEEALKLAESLSEARSLLFTAQV